jgi:hypothetical protein
LRHEGGEGAGHDAHHELYGDVNTFGGTFRLGTMATTGSLIATFFPSSGADLAVAHSPQQATVVTLTPNAPTTPTTPTWQPAHEPSISPSTAPSSAQSKAPSKAPSTAQSTAQTLLTADSGSAAAGAGLIEVRPSRQPPRASPCGCSRWRRPASWRRPWRWHGAACPAPSRSSHWLSPRSAPCRASDGYDHCLAATTDSQLLTGACSQEQGQAHGSVRSRGASASQ